ncbi:unnamed protein product [Acanthoscelides obtectus]|uniref:Uncharacterized protein n=1 Tax=Acanthoscelides obtectus TaxID=200917 RepID=A0A9P0JZZ3_ACAOB|nr:unnamed protein product [Acanthoscelides obtectus]CAK1648632.1 hypothetical protein AOBTE_LOCUS15793 [Acanthoscelides obtectus]
MGPISSSSIILEFLDALNNKKKPNSGDTSTIEAAFFIVYIRRLINRFGLTSDEQEDRKSER